jgi:hypothetical protein
LATSKLFAAKQAVADATEILVHHGFSGRQVAAAALRALAVRINGADAIRQDILDIADELENQ